MLSIVAQIFGVLVFFVFSMVLLYFGAAPLILVVFFGFSMVFISLACAALCYHVSIHNQCVCVTVLRSLIFVCLCKNASLHSESFLFDVPV